MRKNNGKVRRKSLNYRKHSVRTIEKTLEKLKLCLCNNIQLHTERILYRFVEKRTYIVRAINNSHEKQIVWNIIHRGTVISSETGTQPANSSGWTKTAYSEKAEEEEKTATASNTRTQRNRSTQISDLNSKLNSKWIANRIE